MPASARQGSSPIYRRPPVLGAIDFSPDGKWLAVGGFHEVCSGRPTDRPWSPGWSGSPRRIESVRFSPDGTRARRHRRPARPDGRGPNLGRRRRRSPCRSPSPSTPSTGRAGRPTARKIPRPRRCRRIIACVRLTRQDGGPRSLFIGPTATGCSTPPSRPTARLSVGRDMATKLTEVATQRFVDNITSITPGAAKGGLAAVARHPKTRRDPHRRLRRRAQLYRVFRQTVRVVGDDSNIIREFEPMKGRINAAPPSAETGSGSPPAAASTAPARSTSIRTVSTPACPTTSRPSCRDFRLRNAQGGRRPPEIHEGRREADLQVDSKTPSSPRSRSALTAGPSPRRGDGQVRIINSETGATIKEFAPAPLSQQESPGERIATSVARSPRSRSRPRRSRRGRRSSRHGGPAEDDRPQGPLRLYADSCVGQARIRRPDRRDADGRGEGPRCGLL